MEFFTIYIIGAIITFILANSQMQGKDKLQAALFAGAVWPFVLIIRILLWYERK